MAARFQLQLLGPFRASIGGAAPRPLPLSAHRHRALLAYLASQPGHAETRERLATLLWSDSSDAQARHSLRQSLLTLRKELAEADIDIIRADRKMVALDPHLLEVDTRDLIGLSRSDVAGDLERAFAVYQGDFLQGFTAGAEVFDAWAAGERDRLRAAVRTAVERYLAMPGCNAGKAVEVLARSASLDPFDQAAQRLLLKVLAQAHGNPTALAQAEAFTRHLHRELGEQPDIETSALIARLRLAARNAERTPMRAVPPVGAPVGTMARAHASDVRLFENVPPRDLNFIGRSRTLATLHALLNDDVGAASVNRAAINGLGGIGKTSLAAEYAHRYAADYAGVWWARAAQRAPLVESLAALAATLDPRLEAQADREKAALAGLALLARLSKPFLLIYDNVESPDVLKDLLPPPGAKVIVTSRWPDWAGRAVELKLDVFEEVVASEFLEKRAGRTDRAGARRLAAALGSLPLALDHAAAYCKLTAMSFDSYLGRIDAFVARAPKGAAYPTSIAATFGLAIETAAKQHDSAETLLGLFSFLAPERIPLGLVPDAVLAEDSKAEAMAALYSVSLVEPATDSDGATVVTLHPLVQAAMRIRLAERRQSGETVAMAVGMLAHAFPANALSDPQAWPLCARLLPHALALREQAAAELKTGALAARLFHAVGNYLQIRGAYRDAERLYCEAIALAQSGTGKNHADIDAMNASLALLLSTVGRYAEAEPILRQVIASGEKMLGRRHLEVARRLNNLARLLSDTKRYGEAEPLLRAAVAIADKAVGGDAACAVAWRNNLGILLNETGRNTEGDAIYREALGIGEAALGRKHHEVARTMNNLGRLLRDVDRLDEAEANVRDALAIWADMLGDTHPIFARGQENLAVVLIKKGQPDAAIALARAALVTHETALGANHFWTRDSARTCADAYFAANRPGEAEALRLRYGLAPELLLAGE